MLLLLLLYLSHFCWDMTYDFDEDGEKWFTNEKYWDTPLTLLKKSLNVCGLEIGGSRNSLGNVRRKSWGRSPCTFTWVKIGNMDSILKESVLTNKQSKKIIRFSSTAWRRFWLGHSPKVQYLITGDHARWVCRHVKALLSINIVMDETDKKLSMRDLWRKSKCRIDNVIKVWDNLSCGENFFEKSKSWQYINVISLMYLHYNINYVQASRRISDEKMEEDAGKIFYYLYEVVTAYLYIGVIPYLSSCKGVKVFGCERGIG